VESLAFSDKNLRLTHSIKVSQPFCNVTLHPISPIEYFAIWEVFIDGEVKRRENGSVTQRDVASNPRNIR